MALNTRNAAEKHERREDYNEIGQFIALLISYPLYQLQTRKKITIKMGMPLLAKKDNYDVTYHSIEYASKLK